MSGDTVVIGAVTITRADIDAIAGGRAALKTLADVVSPDVAAEMLADEKRLATLAGALTRAIVQHMQSQASGEGGRPS